MVVPSVCRRSTDAVQTNCQVRELDWRSLVRPCSNVFATVERRQARKRDADSPRAAHEAGSARPISLLPRIAPRQSALRIQSPNECHPHDGNERQERDKQGAAGEACCAACIRRGAHGSQSDELEPLAVQFAVGHFRYRCPSCYGPPFGPAPICSLFVRGRNEKYSQPLSRQMPDPAAFGPATPYVRSQERIDGPRIWYSSCLTEVAYDIAPTPWTAAMMQNVVAGCVVAALIVMGMLAFAQKHDEFCRHGHLIKTFRPCGSLSPSM